MSVDSLGMTLRENDSVRMWASRSEDWACLAITGGRAHCEIRMDRVHVETLRAQLPAVLAGLDRTAAEDAACEKAENASERAVDAAANALDMALLADAAGAHEVAASVREAAANATAAANAVDSAVREFGHAATAADCAADSLIYVTREADGVVRRLRNAATTTADAAGQSGANDLVVEPGAGMLPAGPDAAVHSLTEPCQP